MDISSRSRLPRRTHSHTRKNKSEADRSTAPLSFPGPFPFPKRTEDERGETKFEIRETRAEKRDVCSEARGLISSLVSRLSSLESRISNLESRILFFPSDIENATTLFASESPRTPGRDGFLDRVSLSFRSPTRDCQDENVGGFDDKKRQGSRFRQRRRVTSKPQIQEKTQHGCYKMHHLWPRFDLRGFREHRLRITTGLYITSGYDLKHRVGEAKNEVHVALDL